MDNVNSKVQYRGTFFTIPCDAGACSVQVFYNYVQSVASQVPVSPSLTWHDPSILALPILKKATTTRTGDEVDTVNGLLHPPPQSL